MDHFKTCNKSAHDCYHSHAWIITIENCFSKLTFEIQLLTLSSSYTCSNNLEFMLRYIKLYYAERLLVHHVCPSSKTDSPKLSMFSYHNQRSQRLSTFCVTQFEGNQSADGEGEKHRQTHLLMLLPISNVRQVLSSCSQLPRFNKHDCAVDQLGNDELLHAKL